MLGLATNTVLVVSAVGLALLVMLGLVAVVAIQKRIFKLAAFAVAAVLVWVAWSQRAALQDCVDDVTATVRAGGPRTTCTFLGLDLDVILPTGDAP